ncbi:class I SAM-dependent methyltransferase [uncultured Methanobrevibacter sp.]|uniref:class I SAM-dependent methyltransferase n=1 Tax=uncultured Methanobrevibacter sp. TaxID=253161 RepID=UPI00263423CA|nr:class I SAM-dependent methyltransferase [uncultured Methanobrevibacter sp.]
MNAKERTKQHFNQTACDYNNSSDGKFVKPMYESLVNEIQKLPGGKLLDVGCGNGNLFKYLSGSEYELFGVDFSQNMIKEAENNCQENASFKVADAESLPFDSDMFDIIVCNASFHHYIHPDNVLREMHRVLRDGGKLLIGDPYIPTAVRPVMNVLTKFSDKGDYHFYGENEMKKLFKKIGFVPVSFEKTSPRTALHIAEK